jgi:hypothetical protein
MRNVTIRLVQLERPQGERRLALVDAGRLLLLRTWRSVYEAACSVLESGKALASVLEEDAAGESLPYDEIYDLRTEWRVLPAFDHPHEPARCLVSGTGLTHLASARNRQAMHAETATVTDSMRMYQWGVEGGRPEAGRIGVPPEWFYKGCGTILRGHGEPLVVPEYAGDGGEEPEIAGAYVIDPAGRPWRVGLMTANEFSDHRTEKKNYLYLAPSKLRTCSVGPELVIGADFEAVAGRVAILRGDGVIWSKDVGTGQANMAHSLANLEHHHFKFVPHRRPGDAHIHFFGADAFSFGAGIALEDGDVMEVAFQGFGRPLRNPVRIEHGAEELISVAAL